MLLEEYRYEKTSVFEDKFDTPGMCGLKARNEKSKF